MSPQPENKHDSVTHVVDVTEARQLLFDAKSLQEAVRLEDEADCDISAGLDWGFALASLMQNPGLFGRLNQLRVSLNRELRLLLLEWNLGIGTTSAVNCARQRLLKCLQYPSADVLPALHAILVRSELYDEEFISDHEALRSLLAILLTDTDWELVATAAANSIREQVVHQVDEARISA